MECTSIFQTVCSGAHGKVIPLLGSQPACMCAKLLELWLTLRATGLQPAWLLFSWDSPGARTLEWVAVPSSRGSSRPRDQTHVSAISCTGRQALNQQRHLGSLPVLWGPPYPPRVSISIHNDLQEIKSWLLAGGSLACQKTFDNRETFLIAQTVSSVS